MIRTNGFHYFILSSSCWAEAASLVADEKSEGVTVFVPEITSRPPMCGLGSDGIVPSFLHARFSAAAVISSSSPALDVAGQSSSLCAQLQGPSRT